MKRTQWALPALGSAAVAITSQQMSRMVELSEDDSATAQGIVLFFPQDNFTAGYTYKAGKQPVVLGDKVAFGKGRGPIVGVAQQKATDGTVLSPATTLCEATSASATPTTLVSVEHD